MFLHLLPSETYTWERSCGDQLHATICTGAECPFYLQIRQSQLFEVFAPVVGIRGLLMFQPVLLLDRFQSAEVCQKRPNVEVTQLHFMQSATRSRECSQKLINLRSIYGVALGSRRHRDHVRLPISVPAVVQRFFTEILVFLEDR